MGKVKQLISKTRKHARRQKEDSRELDEIGSVTDDKLRREIGSLASDLKKVDANYVKFVKKYTRFGEDGGKSQYNKDMLEKARVRRVRAQIERYQKTMAEGVSGTAIAKVVGHVAINAVFNKQFRNDFLGAFKKPIERTAQRLANAGGQASISAKILSNGNHVPFDARSAALTELAQTLKFNEDMSMTKDPAKRQWLIDNYQDSLNALYDWAKEDGVSGDSIRRMRNVMLDKDSRSENPKFSHLYEGMEFMKRDSQRLEFFDHLDEGVFVWEGDLKDIRTGEKFKMLVNVPEYGEIKGVTLASDDTIDEVDMVEDEQALVDDAFRLHELDEAGELDYLDEAQSVEEQSDLKNVPESVTVEWKDGVRQPIRLGTDTDFSRDDAESNDIVIDFTKVEPNLEIGSEDYINRMVHRKQISDELKDDLVTQRFSSTVDKSNWERTVDDLARKKDAISVRVNLNIHDGKFNPASVESIRRAAEFELVNKELDNQLDKTLNIVSESKSVAKEPVALEFGTKDGDTLVFLRNKERARRQERIIDFDEVKASMTKQAKDTKTITDDELVSKMELALADAGLGADIVKDAQDYELGN